MPIRLQFSDDFIQSFALMALGNRGQTTFFSSVCREIVVCPLLLARNRGLSPITAGATANPAGQPYRRTAAALLGTARLSPVPKSSLRWDRRALTIMQQIYLSPSMKDIVMAESMEFPKSVEPIVEIHKEIQGLAPAITEGLAPFLVQFIGTCYSGSKEARQRYVETMRQDALRQSLEIPPTS